MLSSFEGMRYFSSIDLVKGFWQIGLEPESIPITAIATPLGQYEFLRMPFGINSGPGKFQSIMTYELRGLEANVMVYIDDILIFTRTFEEHMYVLRQVLTRLGNAGLKISPKKCHFVRTELIYLGCVINSLGIATNVEKVKAVAELPDPQNLKDVQSIMGKLNYYARFIPNFAKLAKPINLLRKKDAPFVWGQEQKEAFAKLKVLLCTAPVLRHPRFDLEFILATDASGYGIGAVLSQIQDEEEHPIAYASRTLLEAECRYAVIEREALGIYWGVNHFDEYLDGPKHFTIYTDHKPLCALMTKQLTNKRLVNYAARLSGYNFTICYRKGIHNANADVLSRYPVVPLQGKKYEQPGWAEQLLLSGDAGLSDTVSAVTVSDPPLTTEVWLKEQREYPPYKTIIEHLTTGQTTEGGNTQGIESSTESYGFGEHDELVRIDKTGKKMICVPPSLRTRIIHDAHDVPTAAHGGRDKTLKLLERDYWWSTMYKDVVDYITRCVECQKFKRARKVVQPMGERPIPMRVWERLHMDIWSPGGKSVKGNAYVIAFVDTVSKYLVAVSVKNKTAETVAKTFVKRLVAIYGPPEELYSDGAAEFRSTMVRELSKVFGTTRRITTPYRPQANGQIERVFATLRPMLAAISEASPREWDELLPYVVYAYNVSYHRSIRNTPFYLMFGRDPSLGAVGLSAPHHNLQGDSVYRMKLLAQARKLALESIQSEARKRKEWYDAQSRPFQFQEGDIVMLKSIRPPHIQAAKLYPWYVGPYRVVRVVGGNVLGVVPMGHNVTAVRHIHADRARLSTGDCTPNADKEELLAPFVDLSQIDPNLDKELDE
jgi:hypothetical protein